MIALSVSAQRLDSVSAFPAPAAKQAVAVDSKYFGIANQVETMCYFCDASIKALIILTFPLSLNSTLIFASFLPENA